MDETAARSLQPSFLIVVGGEPTAPARLPGSAGIDPATLVIAADSGVDRAMAAALPVHHVVGDLDSASPAAVAAAEAGGARVHRHAADKDATDLELAIDLVIELATRVGFAEPGELLVVGSGGGRLDHQLADLLALGGPRLAGWSVRARFAAADVAFARAGVPAVLDGVAHEQVSLLPLHGPACDVTTTGLRWPLVHADLGEGTTRAMSNELLGGGAEVHVGEGVLAVIAPGTVAPLIAPRTTPYDPTPTLPEPEPEPEPDERNPR